MVGYDFGSLIALHQRADQVAAAAGAVIVREGLEGASVRRVATEAASRMLMCLVDGLLLQSILEPRRLSADRQVEILDAALGRLR